MRRSLGSRAHRSSYQRVIPQIIEGHCTEHHRSQYTYIFRFAASAGDKEVIFPDPAAAPKPKTGHPQIADYLMVESQSQPRPRPDSGRTEEGNVTGCLGSDWTSGIQSPGISGADGPSRAETKGMGSGAQKAGRQIFPDGPAGYWRPICGTRVAWRLQGLSKIRPGLRFSEYIVTLLYSTLQRAEGSGAIGCLMR